jgi:imidazolonepropionase-like amidohydrolase
MLRSREHGELFVLLLALCSTAALAQTQTSILLVSDHLFDVQSGKLLDHQAVLVTHGKIEKIAPLAEMRPPPDTQRIDFPPGTTLIPGLVDAHTHLLQSFDPKLGGDDPAQVLEDAEQSTARRALLGAKNAREDLLAGITTVRDVGNSGVNGDVALKYAIRKGWVQGPRMVVSTRALAPIGGQFPRLAPEAKGLIDLEYAVITGPEQARMAVRQALYDGADCIKVIVDTDFNTLDVDEIRAIVDETHRLGKKVAAHATGELAISTAISGGVDSIEHGYHASDASLKVMAERQIYLTPTDVPIDSEVFADRSGPRQNLIDFTENNKKRLRRAVALGVPIAFGSDEYDDVTGKTRGQASLETLTSYVRSGMSPIQIIQSATINAATLLGLEKEIGSLEVGKSADIVAVAGNPLSGPLLLQRIGFVMKTGEIARNDMQFAHQDAAAL